MRKIGLIAGLLAAVLLSACAAPHAAVDKEQVSPQERQVARFSHVTAENGPKHQAATRFADAARDRTGGHVEVQVYPNSQLSKDVQELADLQNGTIQFIAPSTAKLIQIDARWGVFDLPYLFDSFDDVERLFASPAGLQLRKVMEAKGMLPLAIWPNGFKQFTNQHHPLVRPEDFKGLAFRVQGEGILQDQFQALGAHAVVSGFDSVYAELEQKAIDGQENTLSNIYTRNLQELQPYLSLSDHGYLAYVVMVQTKWWNGLDPQVRSALQGALDEATHWIRDNARSLNDQALAKIIASGRVQVRPLSPQEREALRTAFEPVYRDASARFGSEFVDQVLSAARGH